MKPVSEGSSSARKAILQRISDANRARRETPADQQPDTVKTVVPDSPAQALKLPDAVEAHLQNARPHTLPSWSTPVDVTARLVEQMEMVQISVTRVQTRENVVEAVAEYLREESIDGDLVISPSLANDADLAWSPDAKSGAARDALTRGVELTSVTSCLCAVAETGSIVTASDADHPSTNNFLPDNHVVVLHENQVTKHVDGVWDLLRSESVDGSAAKVTDVPRAVNFLTGPSRTADIEQTLELGAHGPKRMHIILVAADAPRN